MYIYCENIDIHKHFEHRIGYLPLLQQPIGCLPVGSWTRDIGGARELLTLLTHELLIDVFRLLLDGTQNLSLNNSRGGKMGWSGTQAGWVSGQNRSGWVYP